MTTFFDSKAARIALLLCALAALTALTTACSAPTPPATESAAPAQSTAPAEAATTPADAAETTPAADTNPADTTSDAAAKVTKLKITDKKKGTGATAKPGMLVTVDYTGWLLDGTKFDSSLDRNQPFQFPLGAGQVIEGWDKGVAGMKVGGTRILIIPSDMGYGPQGTPDGTIPPNAPLKFEVKLLKVEPAQ